MQKVVFGSQVFSWQRYGGISRYIVELASALNKRSDVKPILIAGFHDNIHVRELNDPGLKIVGVNLPWLRRGRRSINKLLDEVTLSLHGTSVYHASSYYPIPKTKNPMVVTCYDCIHEEFPMEEDPTGNLAKGKIDELRKVDRIICISDRTRNDLLRHYDLDPDKLKTVHLGIHHRLINRPKLIDGEYILFVGNRSGYKKAETLFRAFSQIQSELPGWKLVLAGGRNFSEKESNLLIQLEISKKVIYQPINQKQLESLYQHAQMFVFPSAYEGFGLPVLEAMSAGCPVIVSDGGSLPEVAGNAALSFPVGDERALAGEILKIAFSSSEADRLRELGLQRVKKFSWEKCAAETLAVYKTLS